MKLLIKELKFINKINFEELNNKIKIILEKT